MAMFPNLTAALAGRQRPPVAGMPTTDPMTGALLTQPTQRPMIVQKGGPTNDMLAQALLAQGNSGEPIHSGLELAGRLAQVWSGNRAEDRYQKDQKQQQLDAYHGLADALANGGGDGTGTDWATVLKTSTDPAVAKFALDQLGKAKATLSAADLVQVPGPDGTPTYLPATQAPGKPAYVKPPPPAGRWATPEEKTTAGLDPKAPVWIDGDGTPKVVSGGGVTVNNQGNIPAGYRLKTDPATGDQSMEPIPGSPAANEAAAAAGKIDAATAARGTTADLVSDTLDRTISAIEANPSGTTGWGGAFFKFLPQSQAQSVQERLTTIKANIGFDKLQAMRTASPTGGALGQVSNFENSLLQATYGSLEQSQDSSEILYNLKRIKTIYDGVTGRDPATAPTIAAIGKAVDSKVITPEEGKARIDALMNAPKPNLGGVTTLPGGITIQRIQ